MEILFLNRDIIPDAEDVQEVLGGLYPAWEGLKKRVANRCGECSSEWTWGGKKYGWSLRLMKKKRALLYMKPLRGQFLVSFALGGKAVASTMEANPPEWLKELLKDASKFPEGYAVRLEVVDAVGIEQVMEILEIKLSY